MRSIFLVLVLLCVLGISAFAQIKIDGVHSDPMTINLAANSITSEVGTSMVLGNETFFTPFPGAFEVHYADDAIINILSYSNTFWKYPQINGYTLGGTISSPVKPVDNSTLLYMQAGISDGTTSAFVGWVGWELVGSVNASLNNATTELRFATSISGSTATRWKINSSGNLTGLGETYVAGGVQNTSMADTGDASISVANVSPTGNTLFAYCFDTNGGCQLNILETDSTNRTLVVMNNELIDVTVVKTTGIVELDGAANVTLGFQDSLTLLYTGANGKWIEIGRLIGTW